MYQIATSHKSEANSDAPQGGDRSPDQSVGVANSKLRGSEELLKKLERLRPPKKKIISVWRYPGISPKRMIPLPEGLLEELEKDSE